MEHHNSKMPADAHGMGPLHSHLASEIWKFRSKFVSDKVKSGTPEAKEIYRRLKEGCHHVSIGIHFGGEIPLRGKSSPKTTPTFAGTGTLLPGFEKFSL